jgi:spore cortex formation protein SpoVR/YcgB (stage V sporulation)
MRVPTRNRQTDVDHGAATVDRVNVALIEQAAQAIAKLQARTGLKKVDIVNRALSIYEYIDAEIKAGNELVIKDPQGSEQRLKIF